MLEAGRPAVLRFAPSPNGRLHLGHAYSALLNWELANATGGTFLLRIEDIDITRCTPEYIAACLDDLRWLGLRWEEPVRIQSQHFSDYKEALDSLNKRGLLYPCFCSRKEITESSHALDPDGAPIYPGTCKHLSPQEAMQRQQNEPYALRLDTDKALALTDEPLFYVRFSPFSGAREEVPANPARWGDAVMARKDIPTSYHISVTVDDAQQSVSHIVRGKDLEASTCLHVLLQKLLKLPTPFYHHHKLLTDNEGDKLAKSRKSEPLSSLRQRGVAPEEVRTLLKANGLALPTQA